MSSVAETHATPALAEAARLMTVCNSCRYCEGLCAVFPAMEMRRSFSDGDLNYLANLCHGCGACFVDCQFAPPHEYNVNVPKVLAVVRAESWRANAWPASLAPLFDRNGLAIATITAVAVAGLVLGFIAWNEPSALFAVHNGPGAFYRLMPHNTMAVLFGAAFIFAIVAIAMAVRRFWLAIGDPQPIVRADLVAATSDAATLKYLDGGGAGCASTTDGKPDRRRLYHHLTFYGFLACFAATSVATLYHYLLGREAPFPWWDAPVVLGTLGGIGLIVGPIGLLLERGKRDPLVRDTSRSGMDTAFVVMLLATSVTGLALLVARATPAMGLLLAIHLGVVLALFVTMPYGRFVHGIYRSVALVRYARERRMT